MVSWLYWLCLPEDGSLGAGIEPKARRGWKDSRVAAEAEVARRAAKSKVMGRCFLNGEPCPPRRSPNKSLERTREG